MLLLKNYNHLTFALFHFITYYLRHSFEIGFVFKIIVKFKIIPTNREAFDILTSYFECMRNETLSAS